MLFPVKINRPSTSQPEFRCEKVILVDGTDTRTAPVTARQHSPLRVAELAGDAGVISDSQNTLLLETRFIRRHNVAHGRLICIGVRVDEIENV